MLSRLRSHAMRVQSPSVTAIVVCPDAPCRAVPCCEPLRAGRPGEGNENGVYTADPSAGAPEVALKAYRITALHRVLGRAA